MSYETYPAGEPVTVTAALTGGVHGEEVNPAIPETPTEIGAAAAAAEAAGASTVHLHARQNDGERAFSTDRFQDVTDAVRHRTEDVIIQHSTGGTGASTATRAQPLRTDPLPEMASLDTGPLNRYDHLTSETTRATVATLHEEMQDRGIKPELELFKSRHVNETHRLLERRDLDEPLCATLIVGSGTLTRPRPRTFLTAIDDLPEGTLFNTLGFGPHRLAFPTMGVLFGGHVRVGLEDNGYYERGRLVERVADTAETPDRPVATTDQTRAILDF